MSKPNSTVGSARTPMLQQYRANDIEPAVIQLTYRERRRLGRSTR
jgi:hypothetical protein